MLLKQTDVAPSNRSKPQAWNVLCGPDLYFNSTLCETVEQATDTRRLERQGMSTAIWDNEEDDVEGQTRGSIRRSFVLICLTYPSLPEPEQLKIELQMTRWCLASDLEEPKSPFYGERVGAISPSFHQHRVG